MLLKLFLLLATLATVVKVVYEWNDPSNDLEALKNDLRDVKIETLESDKREDQTVTIVFAVCGPKQRYLEEAVVMVKSAVLISNTDLHFIVFTDQRGFLEPRLKEITARTADVLITIDFKDAGKCTHCSNPEVMVREKNLA